MPEERLDRLDILPRPAAVETIPSSDSPTSQRSRRHSDEEDQRITYAFGHNDYLLPENFKTLRRQDIPVTYRLHDDLLRYYRKVFSFIKSSNWTLSRTQSSSLGALNS
ncbi:unnamed protein product, partial [Mesorhabditis belari]|uniref:Uncharacterized protein n=1 Tax=Mesorhabditis belari TaxID=2138241 RepID=A0AAF3JC34_9BILA